VCFRPAIALTLTLAVLGGACSSGDDTSTVGDEEAARTSAAPRPYKPAWADTPCTVEIPSGVVASCGTLTVPENRARPDRAKVTLPVVRLHSTAAEPAPDPVVYLHGGPGSGVLQRGIARRAQSPVLQTRDLILFDQRGTGLAVPSLECPEREEAFLQALSAAAPYDEELASFDAALEACFERLTDEGHDLDQYNSETNAADLADLRVVLGIDEWNLWGVSYGTRLALTEMRSYPDGLRSVVLDSVYPPSAGAVDETIKSGQRAFDALANGCGTDPQCEARFPDVPGDLDKLAADLDAAPYAFDYTFEDGTQRSFQITGSDAVGGLFNAMYDTELIPQLPSAIHDFANGGRALMPVLASEAVPFVNNITEGAFLSYECADNSARADDAMVAKLRKDAGRATLLVAGWSLFCDQWPVRPLAAEYGEVVMSDIPTLVIAGEYDPITPPATSKAVADALDDSVFIQVPHGGHGPAPDTQCSLDVFTRFFDEGTAVDTSCVATIVPAPFA
jgi:pimeloyl-ACP methyl ester carboxylesterase